jgi:hypothetical protein
MLPHATYFLRQLFQSLPAVLLVFSETTASAFITAMKSHFVAGSPAPGESIPALLSRKIVLRYGTVRGRDLTGRVIFTPHASANPADFAAERDKVIAALVEEAQAGHLVFNPKTGHLQRPVGSCVFCANALYRIGPCDYEKELKPLSGTPPQPSMEMLSKPEYAMPEKAVQQKLLEDFLHEAAHHNRAQETKEKSSPFAIKG